MVPPDARGALVAGDDRPCHACPATGTNDAVRDEQTGVGPSDGIAGYYDRLIRWTRVAQVFGYGGGHRELTVHRRLTDPRMGGRPTSTRVHDIIVESLPKLVAPRILDAGCGLGGTMLELVCRYDGTAVGLTLSPEQRRRAALEAAARGMADRVDVRVQTFDAPPPGPFDLIVAIESLAHSSDPHVSVTALASGLRPGGWFVIVDDMPEAEALGSADFEIFRRGWEAPVVWTRRDYLAAFTHLGLRTDVDRDLTPESPVRTLTRIRRLEVVNRCAHALVPHAGWRGVLDSYYGGLALERLYRRGAMRYRLLAAVRPS